LTFARLLAKPLPLPEQENAVSLALRLILQKTIPEQIFLFGSGARWERTAYSDLDFLLIYSSKEDLKLARDSGVFSVSSALGIPCDFLLFDLKSFSENTQRSGVCQVVYEEGLLLFENRVQLFKKGNADGSEK
jgi:predicted nucleotidyltransferase